jgi:hypothetical protein
MKKDTLIIAILIILAILGVVELSFSTHWGPGVGGDATIYITSARNLLAGNGIGLINPDGSFRPIPYFPPFFSIVLSAAGLLGIDLVVAANWLNMLLFGGLIWLAGIMTYRASKSAVLAILLALLLLFSPILVPVYSWAMAEPLSIFLGVLGMALMLAYFRKPEGWTVLLLSGLAAGLSFLTRYSAVAYLGAGVLALLFINPKQFRQRLADGLIFLGAGILPMAIWIVYDYSLTATVASRRMETAVRMAERVTQFWPSLRKVLLFWLLPDSWISSPPYPETINRILAALFILAILAWGGLVAWKTIKVRGNLAVGENESLRLAILQALFALVYIAVVIFVYITTYPPITLDSRMFSPLQVTVLWLVILLVGFSIELWPGLRLLKLLLPAVLLIFAVFYGWRTQRIVRQYYRLGLGYTAPAWQNSATIKALNSLPQGIALVTNETNAVLFLTGRTAYPLAEIYSDKPLPVFSRYGDGVLKTDNGQRLFKEVHAPLVLFDTITDQMASIYGDQTDERVKALTNGLRQAFKGDDGAIYYYPGP